VNTIPKSVLSLASAFSDKVRGGLIVSCQAQSGEPLFGSAIMARMAVAAAQGGAVAIRAESPADIAAIRAVVDLPIIGLWKVDIPHYDVYITPRLCDAQAVADAGADIIAVDSTLRPHPDGDLAAYLRQIMIVTGKPVLADIANDADAIAAANAGVPFVSTTMSGYTPYSPASDAPDLPLVRRLVEKLGVPVIAEGRISTPQQARDALDAGALSVVVGGAITRPHQITARFVRALAPQ
jgi:N-acylglucosamine-6-phosphate 2-epimerase